MKSLESVVAPSDVIMGRVTVGTAAVIPAEGPCLSRTVRRNVRRFRELVFRNRAAADPNSTDDTVVQDPTTDAVKGTT